MSLAQLLELDQLARKEGKRYSKKRSLYDQIKSERGKHFTGIVGPRGVGKTILLKQMTHEITDSFYLSLDTLEEKDLFETAKTLVERYQVKFLFLDEIHFQKNYEMKLKEIFDFLNLRVIFTSSVALSLFHSSYDLSRRVKLVSLPPFSFREYLFFKKDISLSPLSLTNILEMKWKPEHLKQEYLFEKYLRGRLLPFSLEEPDVLPLLKNILQKIIHKDIPSVARIRMDEIHSMEKMIRFIGKSSIDGINFTSLSKNIGITKYKAEEYVRLFQMTFVLNPIFPAGANVLKEPKVLMHLPYRLLFKEYEECIGGLREDFFGEMMQMKGINFQYLKTKRGEKTPDFLVKEGKEKIVIEIGGRGKGRNQFKGVLVEKKLILSHSSEIHEEKRPLFLLGFL